MELMYNVLVGGLDRIFLGYSLPGSSELGFGEILVRNSKLNLNL